MLDTLQSIIESIKVGNIEKVDYSDEIREVIGGETLDSLDRSSAFYEDLEGVINFNGECDHDHGMNYHVHLEFDLDGKQLKEPTIEIRDVWWGGLDIVLGDSDKVRVANEIRGRLIC